MEKKTTLGEARVRTDFNVSEVSKVNEIKLLAAQLIDAINAVPEPENTNATEVGEFFRLKSLAMTAIEDGAMWGVKAATA